MKPALIARLSPWLPMLLNRVRAMLCAFWKPFNAPSLRPRASALADWSSSGPSPAHPMRAEEPNGRGGGTRTRPRARVCRSSAAPSGRSPRLAQRAERPIGTGGGTRTHTPLRETDFESVASANSATPASGPGFYRRHQPLVRFRLPPPTRSRCAGTQSDIAVRRCARNTARHRRKAMCQKTRPGWVGAPTQQKKGARTWG